MGDWIYLVLWKRTFLTFVQEKEQGRVRVGAFISLSTKLNSWEALFDMSLLKKKPRIDVQLKFTIEDVLKERREKASPKKNRRQRCKAANESPDRRSSQNVAPGSHVVRSSLIPPEECDLMNRDTMDSSDEGYSSFESVRSDRSIRGSNYQSEADEENFTPTSSPSASPLSSFSSFGKLVHSSSGIIRCSFFHDSYGNFSWGKQSMQGIEWIKLVE